MKKNTFYTHRILLATLMGVVFVVSFMYIKELNTGELHIYFLDIGQGDAVYIRTPGGRDMLIDGGPGGIIMQRLSEVMPWYDRSIDVVLETHPDADHIGGLPQVMSRYRIGMFIEPGVESSNTIDDEISRLRKEKNISRVLARRGMRIDFADGVHFDILYPDIDPSHLETNTASIVGRMVYGSTSVMLTGDSPKSIENYLIEKDGARLQSDILKAGHHGSHSSSGEGFVKIVSPTHAVISSGKTNRYGHPHKDVIEIFERLRIKIVRTDVWGTVEFVSNGKSFRQK